MTPSDFKAWLVEMDYPDVQAAEELGCGRNQPGRWLRTGAPLYIDLACAAIAIGLPPWFRGGFEGWFEYCMDNSKKEAVERLGCGYHSPRFWCRHGAPKYVMLACGAIAYNLHPWSALGK